MPSTPAPRIGALLQGARNAITDVAGVLVGHRTLDAGAIQTGVTVIRAHAGDPFRDKVPAAAVVLNGFGKSLGLVQLAELGVLETPIALTNTFCVGTVATAQIRHCVAANPECGRSLPTVNPLVFECNDGFLNDIQRLAVTEADYLHALESAGSDFAQGSVGAGRGMSSFQLKGGIGSASRCVPAPDRRRHTVGTLVLANYGRQAQLVLAGDPVGARLAAQAAAAAQEPEKGSIIIVVATDAPLDARQLRRLALRAGAGLARTGSVLGHGSGDIVLAFSTACTVPDRVDRPMPAIALLHEELLDGLFQATADSTEQAILHALWHATAVTGRDGNHRAPLGEVLARLPSLAPARTPV
ncbi:S58 family peptidase [Verminephrobacter aporrectodeae subsp. tuberculatae]|uniref:P1 family peptidase n=1 Tax=Verminephrobacter aporrectodeae TaxID=1110389 RepID=UPI0022449D0A|nr:P1 family peptidase [Verminephrobacter aporrectodeae]MCW8166077.1 S58 family peptidase [Verminephrobacter aporrectodeae subsp. tuberculatae]MCW8170724.1 S58 family peptidase [Verminephrobacter aporrectodeae subsp. tuberculatae]